MMNEFDRREFIKFLGMTGVGIAFSPLMQSCSQVERQTSLQSVKATLEDDVVLSQGLSWRKIISWGDKINPTESFGFNNDYINYLELSDDEILLWVNNEYAGITFVSGEERTKENIDKEIKSVGGSIIHLKKEDDEWNFQSDSKYNRRVDGFQQIPFSNGAQVRGSSSAMGTLGNCAGGKTPWGTILTCEENYNYSYGEREFKDFKLQASYNGWEKFYDNPPEHYGWVVEVDLKTGDAVKLLELGRFAHESATVIKKDGVLAVYSGDDKAGEHLYKFVSDSTENLNSGTLYVANLEQGKWLPLDVERNIELKNVFKTQQNVLTYTREAAKLVGATPLDRPEDIEINPHNGDVFVALTNNTKAGNYHGKILKISESRGNYGSEEFTHDDFLIGGASAGFSCPDNLAFDKKGNLWFASDISGSQIGKGEYSSFGNNGLFIVPAKGADMGKVIQVGSAPAEAEFTGICFDPSGAKLFLSVQHPGEKTKDLNNPTSRWPHNEDGIPRPSVIEISGDFLT